MRVGGDRGLSFLHTLTLCLHGLGELSNFTIKGCKKHVENVTLKILKNKKRKGEEKKRGDDVRKEPVVRKMKKKKKKKEKDGRGE